MSHLVSRAGVLLAGSLAMLAAPSAGRADNDVVLQGFYWDVPRGAETGTYWYTTIYNNRSLINSYFKGGIWLPPPSKGMGGGYSMGYDPYDHYDLGQYNQQGTTYTRFGNLSQLKTLLSAITVPKICDIVINHMSGGASEYNPYRGTNTYTKFQYVTHTGPGERAWWASYNDFHPNDYHGDMNAPFHNEAFGMDICQNKSYMNDEIRYWMAWLKSANVGYTGWRFDFVKGIDPYIIRDILSDARFSGNWSVGEFYDGNRDLVKNWILQENKKSKVFDFPLFYTLKDMCNNTSGSFDMNRIRNEGLVNYRSDNTDWKYHTVTFVENHDTDKDDPVRSDKMLAYAYILMAEGQPSVFWKDYFNYGLGSKILTLIKIRRTLVGGTTSVLYSDGDVHIHQRNGSGSLPGAILMLNDNATYTANRTVTTKWANTVLKDYTGNITTTVTTNGSGSVSLSALKRGYSVWAPTGYTLADIETLGDAPTTEDAPAIVAAPATFSLAQNSPNPFNPTTDIQFTLPEASRVRLEVFNSLGQRVAVLVDDERSAGLHMASFNGFGLPSGTYVYRLTAGAHTEVKRMMLMK